MHVNATSVHETLMRNWRKESFITIHSLLSVKLDFEIRSRKKIKETDVFNSPRGTWQLFPEGPGKCTCNDVRLLLLHKLKTNAKENIKALAVFRPQHQTMALNKDFSENASCM